jgi:hypothetical protein
MESINLPTEAGPVPDRISIWPLDDGSYGLDATFQGASGYERAERHIASLAEAVSPTRCARNWAEGWTIRFGPLSAANVSIALSGFVR